MRTKKGIKELITGIIIGEGVKATDLEENAVDRIIEALTEENNLFIQNKKNWYEWVLIWIGFWQLGTWTGALILALLKHLHCN